MPRFCVQVVLAASLAAAAPMVDEEALKSVASRVRTNIAPTDSSLTSLIAEQSLRTNEEYSLGTEDEAPMSSRLHHIAGAVAKRAVVLSTSTFESIPAYWLAMIMVVCVVLAFLLCW